MIVSRLLKHAIPFYANFNQLVGRPGSLLENLNTSCNLVSTLCASSYGLLFHHRIIQKRCYSFKKLLKDGHEVVPTGGTYIIDSPKHAILENIRQCRTIRGRRETNEFIIEERMFIEQALKSGVEIKSIIITDTAHERQLAAAEYGEQIDEQYASLPLDDHNQGNAKIYVIPDKVMEKIFPVDTPAMIGIANMLHSHVSSINDFKSFRKILVLDNILNPRNIGMILRSAEAFGVEGVVLMTGPNATNIGNSADLLYSRLSISASRGAAFRVPFIHIRKSELLQFAQDHKFELICTTPHHDIDIPEWRPIGPSMKSKKKKKSAATKIEQVETRVAGKPFRGQIVVVGNETSGVRKEIMEHADAFLTIPTQVESLNAAVACGIVLFMFMEGNLAVQKGPSKPFVHPLQSKNEVNADSL